MSRDEGNFEGLRERKKRETRERIIERGLELFISEGYTETTIDEIALASKISRRTFFSYFKSKEDVLLTKYDGLLDTLRAEMLKEPKNQPPFEAAQKCLLKMASVYVSKETVAIDRLMRSTETLKNRKESFNIEMENVLTQCMCEIWNADDQDQRSLRLIAMMVIGTVRISQINWRQDEGKYPLTYYLKQNFALLKEQI